VPSEASSSNCGASPYKLGFLRARFGRFRAMLYSPVESTSSSSFRLLGLRDRPPPERCIVGVSDGAEVDVRTGLGGIRSDAVVECCFCPDW